MNKITYKQNGGSVLETVREILEINKFNAGIYKYCAVDDDGAVYIYEGYPTYENDGWCGEEGLQCDHIGNVGDHVTYRARNCMWELDPQ